MVLRIVMAGTVDRKIISMTTIIYSMGYDRFGPEQKGEGQWKEGDNRRELQINKVRGELRRLSKAYRRAPGEERPPLEQLRADLTVPSQQGP